MIKLIATDMDGTLVNDQGHINHKIFDLIDLLHKRNIQFVAASGRFYSQLNDNFEKVQTEMILIAHNGALIKYNHNGTILYSNNLSKEHMKHVINLDIQLGQVLFLSGESKAYVIDPSEDMIRKFSASEVPIVGLNSFDEVKYPIYKMSYYIDGGVNEDLLDHLKKELDSDLEFVVSGRNWVDIMNKGINKGSAIKILQEKFEISPEHTMVFGDYYNDLPMFKVAYHSYAMENAPEAVKKRANFIAQSNKDDGVYHVIYQYAKAL